MKGRGTLRPEELTVDLQQVGPLVRPMLDEVVAADQPVDHRVALGAGVAAVGEKRPHFVGRRRQADQVEVDAAEELGVAAQARGQDLHPLPLGGDQFVDLAPGFRRLARQNRGGRPSP